MPTVVNDLIQATEQEMKAAWNLTQRRRELSAFLAAVCPGLKEREAASDTAGLDYSFVPPVLAAALDEMQACCRQAGAVREKAQRRKGAAIERHLLERGSASAFKA